MAESAKAAEFLLFGAALVGCFAGLAIFAAGWMTHLDMTRSGRPWGWGDWDKFLREFGKRDWQRSETWPTSYFSHDLNSQIHASIIEFSGRGMCLPPWDYLRLIRWSRRERADRKEERVVW